MKRITCLMLLLWISASYGAVSADAGVTASAILHGKGLLWKIEKPGMLASHIYGTMHVTDARVAKLPAVVEQVFTQADRFIMEMLPGLRATEIIARNSFFQDGRTLKQLMQAEDYQRLSRVLSIELNIPENLYNKMRPWAVIMLLSEPEQGVGTDAVLDMMLYQRAKQRGIDLYGIETAQQQLAALESPSLDEQVWLLNKSVSQYSQLHSTMQQMINLYLQRDLAGLVAMQQQQMYDDSEIDDRFMRVLLDDRNLYMAAQLQQLLPQGNHFIAIGALHLPGDTGVLHLLEQQGYKVTPVY